MRRRNASVQYNDGGEVAPARSLAGGLIVYSLTSRRQFLTTAAGTALLGLGDLSVLAGLRSVSAAEARLDPNLVRLQPDVEPLVRFIEETPRGRLIEETAARIRGGLGYRDLLAALFLAGVRGIRPRPSVGFKFHAVLVVNSAHLASLAAPDSERYDCISRTPWTPWAELS